MNSIPMSNKPSTKLSFWARIRKAASLPECSQDQGFTLLEVLIALTILIFISFAIFQATVATYRLRDVLTTEGDFYNSIRLSTSIMQRDLSMIYSPTSLLPENFFDPTEVDKRLRSGITLPDDLSVASNFWGAAVNEGGIRPSRFLGTESKISFVSISHLRMYKDSAESDFAKITYEVKRDDKNLDHPGTMVLVKSENANAFSVTDDRKDPLNHTYELLHGIRRISYTYYLRDGETWKTFRSWDTEKEETRYRLPDIIEVNVEVEGPKKQIFEGKYKFRPEIPLNGISPTT